MSFIEFCLLFLSKKVVFLSLSFIFFRNIIKFSEQNNNQSETGIGDTKLSMELYVTLVHKELIKKASKRSKKQIRV